MYWISVLYMLLNKQWMSCTSIHCHIGFCWMIRGILSLTGLLKFSKHKLHVEYLSFLNHISCTFSILVLSINFLYFIFRFKEECHASIEWNTVYATFALINRNAMHAIYSTAIIGIFGNFQRAWLVNVSLFWRFYGFWLTNPTFRSPKSWKVHI